MVRVSPRRVHQATTPTLVLRPILPVHPEQDETKPEAGGQKGTKREDAPRNSKVSSNSLLTSNVAVPKAQEATKEKQEPLRVGRKIPRPHIRSIPPWVILFLSFSAGKKARGSFRFFVEITAG
ncbi:hypothetical protein MKZ38_010106 [Zalerion maritima]|uniref:Uncharacterized protein n=1 Tax=Zalerion maritima TaxID=339359 RepID=A0AAD5RFT9_9PEZI|nr:hypothetical protein MKZ38_010106 [Zalerion maritima]